MTITEQMKGYSKWDILLFFSFIYLIAKALKMTNANKNVVAVKGVLLNEGKVLIVQRAQDDEMGGGFKKNHVFSLNEWK
ncbi:hypothetical protein JFL43_05005 [Viridibacillus sp. YIM B01967]|uniref:Nudix hydrolase domain-containing protein n=1 Tax=Viridibacillus soli TaxID=2798301 RepID=A0ABS1H479_9BACL|nr:hypothetical protein [Viridibacillus soli]MBK3494224.1 hypothetical protein [Viridibacillus soli]